MKDLQTPVGTRLSACVSRHLAHVASSFYYSRYQLLPHSFILGLCQHLTLPVSFRRLLLSPHLLGSTVVAFSFFLVIISASLAIRITEQSAYVIEH